jgi:hypothetical protein
LGLLILGLSSCKQEPDYINDYQLDNVTSFYIHSKDRYPLFVTDEGDIKMLYDTDTLGFTYSSTRVQILFGNHEEGDDSFQPLSYLTLNELIGVEDNETIVQILDYFEGWLFLTDQGHVYKYSFVSEPRMDQEFYIASSSNNLLPLEPGETITQMIRAAEFGMEVLQFETSNGRMFYVEENSLNAIFGYPLYDETIFEAGEDARHTLLFWPTSTYYIVTTNNRVLEYNTELEDVQDVTSAFSLAEGEEIIAFQFEQNNRTVYVTNKGRLVSINLMDLTIYEDATLQLSLDPNEEITSYQRGKYTCREGMALMTTSLGSYYYTSGPFEEAKEFDPSIVPLEEGDSISTLTMSNYFTGSCGSSYQIFYDGTEIRDFEFILRIETTLHHIYLLGVTIDDPEDEITILQIT